MGIAVFSHNPSRVSILSVLSAPLQTLFGLFSPTPAVLASCDKLPSDASAGEKKLLLEILPSCEFVQKDLSTFCEAGKNNAPLLASIPRSSRLRVVRAIEQGANPSSVGRMVISGRMSDVCAELERMAQREQFTYKN